MKMMFLMLICFPVFFHAQETLSGEWKLSDGSCVYEFRTFEDGHLEARLMSSTRKNEHPGRIVLDHVEPHGKGYSAVIHSAETDVPREVILTMKNNGNMLELEIPRLLSPVHISWTRVSGIRAAGGSSSTLSLNE